MTAYASCFVLSDLLCVFGCVCPLHSGHESHFVVFLVAFCERQGLYQSVVTQSVSCLGAGLVLTMLMTSLLPNCEALWFYLWEAEWTLFSCSKYICTEAPMACLTWMSHNFARGQLGVLEKFWWQSNRGNNWEKQRGKSYSWPLGWSVRTCRWHTVLFLCNVETNLCLDTYKLPTNFQRISLFFPQEQIG